MKVQCNLLCINKITCYMTFSYIKLCITTIWVTKGLLISEWIYEVIVSLKKRTKNCQNFCPHYTGQISWQFFVHILIFVPYFTNEFLSKINLWNLKINVKFLINVCVLFVNHLWTLDLFMSFGTIFSDVILGWWGD